MPETRTIPLQINPEQLDQYNLDQYARDRRNAIRRKSYAARPDTALRQRLVCAANLLKKNGLIDGLTHSEIMEQVGGGLHG